MQASTAQVIDLQSYRRARFAKAHASEASSAFDMGRSPMMPVAWLPVWYVPVFFMPMQDACAPNGGAQQIRP